MAGKLKLAAVGLVLSVGPVFSQGNSMVSLDEGRTAEKTLLATPCDMKGGYYMVDGSDSATVRYVKGKRSRTILDKKHLPTGVKFTSIAVAENKMLFLGTGEHFVYGWKNRKLHHFNYLNGLSDSTILSINVLKKNNKLIVQTPTKEFALVDNRNPKKIKFKYLHPSSGLPNPSVEPNIMSSLQEPLNKAVCYLFADVDYSFKKQKAIHGKELKEIKQLLLPGDILIKRNDYQLSNIGIPGFWTHSGIFLGSLNDMDEFFDGIEFLKGQTATEYIKMNHFDAYRLLNNRKNMIIEAIGDGVLVNPLEHIAKVDYFAGLRPQLNKNDLFRSLLVAFTYLNYPYDYLFDFGNDDELVCSELVYRSFGKGPEKNGIDFAMSMRNGQYFLSPNDLALQFSSEFDNPNPQFELVVYCGVSDNGKKAVFKKATHFVETVKKLPVFESELSF